MYNHSRKAKKGIDFLQKEISFLEETYNPDHLDLHFELTTQADKAFFDSLYSLGSKAWELIKKDQSWENSYCFYDLLLLISSGSLKCRLDGSQVAINVNTILNLAFLLIDISQMTTIPRFRGDITKRNMEALGNLLLAFTNITNLRRLVKQKAKELNKPNVTEFVNRTLKRVEEVEQKNN